MASVWANWLRTDSIRRWSSWLVNIKKWALEAFALTLKHSIYIRTVSSLRVFSTLLMGRLGRATHWLLTQISQEEIPGMQSYVVCNQVPSLSLFRWRTLTLLKIKIGWMFWCFKLQTIVSYWEEYYESMQSWLLSQVWNIKTPNLSIFSTEKIPRILNHKMVQGGDLIS